MLWNTTYANIAGEKYSAYTPGAVYPEDYGIGCKVHDNGLAPYCEPTYCTDGEYYKRWCGERWCWVNATKCNGTTYFDGYTYYFAPVELAYSYTTCNSTNVFDAFYVPLIGPRPPPALPPSTPPPQPAYPFPRSPPSSPPLWPSPVPREYHVEVSVGVGSGVLAIALLAWLAVALYRRWKRAEAALVESETLEVKAAIATTNTLGHAAVLVPAETFLQMGRMRPYEEMRDAHKLTFRDSLEHLRDIEGFGAFIIFISHQVHAQPCCSTIPAAPQLSPT